MAEISSKADVSALGEYLPLSGGEMSGQIQMGSSHPIAFEHHRIEYDSPDGLAFISQPEGFQPRSAILNLMRGPQRKEIAYLNDIE